MLQATVLAGALTGVSLLVNIIYIVRYDRALRRDDAGESHEKPFVSVVVAARNEENTLPMLLTSLMNQSYPQTLYEVIVADDDSTDGTADVVRQFAARWPQLKLLPVRGRDQAASPKKNALSQAIALSRGGVILSTDADCIVGRHWMRAMVACFEDDVAMVAGYSRTMLSDWKRASLVQKFEHFDFFAMFAAAAGAIRMGKGFSCTGQNLGFRRSAYDHVDGYERIAHMLSGDDVNLMQLIRRSGKKIRFAASRHAFAGTRPIESWRQLVNQRARWASNMRWQAQLNPEFFLYLCAVALLQVGMIALTILSWKLGAVVIAAKAVCDYGFLRRHYTRFAFEKERLRFFPLWFLLQYPYLIVVAVLGQLNLFRWKGRTSVARTGVGPASK